MASNMVNRYLDRAGIMEEETAFSVKNEEMGILARQSHTLQEELIQLKEAFSEVSCQLSTLRNQLDHSQNGHSSKTGGAFGPKFA